MIDPNEKDVGRRVLYSGNGAGGTTDREGVITGFDLHCVYVRYGEHTTSEGNRRQDLKWLADR